MNEKQVVLVAGYDFLRSGVSFETICINRMNRLIEISRNLKFTLFDFKSGRVQMNQRNSKGNYTLEVIAEYEPITSDNYDGNIFKRNPEGVMSVTDVYRYIQDIGEKEPSSIVELSFFSHGWREGAALVNSNEGEYILKPERNPDDKDTRSKDFKEPNMNPQNLKSFRSSFDANAFVWVWGCSFDRMFKVVLDGVTKNNKYRKTAPGKLKDTETFTLNYTKETHDYADDFYSRDKQFFPPKNSKGKYPYTFERTFNKIRQFFKRGLYNTYCNQISIASKKKCYGALPGTYASFEKRLKKHELMLVPTRKCVCQQSNPEEREKCCNDPQKKDCYCDDFTLWVKFYTEYIGIKLDPEKRNYGTYV